MMIPVIPLLTRMNRYNRCNNQTLMTTWMQTGNRNLSMLVQVIFVPDCLPALNENNVLEFRTNKPSDIISTLVSIYDSKDLFVKELQVLLAQRLLVVTDNDV